MYLFILKINTKWHKINLAFSNGPPKYFDIYVTIIHDYIQPQEWNVSINDKYLNERIYLPL